VRPPHADRSYWAVTCRAVAIAEHLFQAGTVGASRIVQAGGSGSTFEELLARPAWHRDALCKEPAYADVDFFPHRGDSSDPAKAVCRRCLVCQQCAAYALADSSTMGIWGALTSIHRWVGC
jgi:WhiB family transcriptional regulator, redox-sensing transcriptional regulator